MAIDERRRIELLDRAAEALGREAATTLNELLPPAGDDPATKADVTDEVGDLRTEMRHGFEGVRHELEAMEHRLTALFERRISDAVTTQTRTLVFSQLASVVAIAALAFGLG